MPVHSLQQMATCLALALVFSSFAVPSASQSQEIRSAHASLRKSQPRRLGFCWLCDHGTRDYWVFGGDCVCDEGWNGDCCQTEDIAYGGNFEFVGVPYRMEVVVDGVLSAIEQSTLDLLNWDEVALQPNGNMRRVGETNDIFPLAGMSIQWRYEQPERIMHFDFWSNGARWTWRRDEMIPVDAEFTQWNATGYAFDQHFRFHLTKIS